jgi:hypothetical protein
MHRFKEQPQHLRSMTIATLGQVALRQVVLPRPLVRRAAVYRQRAGAHARALHAFGQSRRAARGHTCLAAASSGALNMTANTPSPQYTALLGKQACARALTTGACN